MGGEAFGDEAAVAIQHDGGHVGLDDAWAQLVDEDVVFGEAVGEDFGHHAHAGLGDAVFGAAGAGDDGAHGADVDDHAGAGPLASMWRARAWVRKRGPRRLTPMTSS